MQIRCDGPPDYEHYGSYDCFQTEFPVIDCPDCFGKGWVYADESVDTKYDCHRCWGVGKIKEP